MPVQKLNLVINKLESYIENHNVSNSKISKSNIGWHVDHSFKVINKVVETLQASEPKQYRDNFSVLGKIFFALGFFPRGKAKAPKYVKPPEIILKEDLINQLQQARENIKTIETLDKNAFFKHPLFGNINKKRVCRFLEVHSNHHLKIMDAIMIK